MKAPPARQLKTERMMSLEPMDRMEEVKLPKVANRLEHCAGMVVVFLAECDTVWVPLAAIAKM